MLLALLAASATTSPATPPDAAPACQRDGATPVVGGKAGFWRLDQLPPANQVLTVLRRVGSCSAPVIVRYDVGRR